MSDYARIAAAIQFYDGANAPLGRTPLADHVGLSEADLQQLFQRWSGRSPDRFLESLTRPHVRRRLMRSRAVVEAALRVEPQPSDPAARFEAATPAQRLPGGLTICWGITDSPYGRVGIGVAARRVCWLEFLAQPEPEGLAERRLARTWPDARLEHHPAAAVAQSARVFAGDHPRLLLGGTTFQRQVWQMLVRIPPGALTTYGTIASSLGRPGAGRAVGRAVGSNPIGYLIPCHRVIRQTGGFASYRWGLVRKKAMLGHEAAQRAVPSSA